MFTVHEFVNGLPFGEPVQFENLAMLPLLATAAAPEPGYRTLDEAVAAGVATVTEVAAGVVPEILFENQGDQPVLLLGGEELVGAKQNRMVNLSILVPPMSKVVIPVSCVEAGRWHFATPEFRPSEFMAFSAMRARSTAEVTQSLRFHRARVTNQMRVWEEIAECAEEHDARSGTGAMRAIFERRFTDIEEFVRALPWQAGQCGAAFLIDGSPAGIDVFDHPRTMQRTLARLVRGYALDALTAQDMRQRPGRTQVPQPEPAQPAADPAGTLRQWLSGLERAETIVEPAVGMGQDIRLEAEAITAAALWALNRCVHFCAFPCEASARDGGRAPGQAMASLEWRRRHLHRRSGGGDAPEDA